MSLKTRFSMVMIWLAMSKMVCQSVLWLRICELYNYFSPKTRILCLIEATNNVQERVMKVQVPVLKIWNLKLFWCHHSVFITLSTIGLCVVVAIVAFFWHGNLLKGIDKKLLENRAFQHTVYKETNVSKCQKIINKVSFLKTKTLFMISILHKVLVNPLLCVWVEKYVVKIWIL